MGNETSAAKEQKTVILGVTGCIAAYKACEILRVLQRQGIRVKIVMTDHATQFVGPLTFRALSGEPVATAMFESPDDPIPHITLAQEADAFLIAPCTANMAAKLAQGIADDLLSSAALATTAPVLIAPAMNVHMYENLATQQNLQTLRDRGVDVVEASIGLLACGDVGRGHIADVEDIVARTLSALGVHQDLAGIRMMITAGPTIEPIDPVRYITNFSSGKTGYMLAEAAARRGAKVTIVSGPVAMDPPRGVEVVRVNTAREMLDACLDVFPEADIAIFAAAVADMRPKEQAAHKLKKTLDPEALKAIEMAENPDIIATLGAVKGERVVVGFAAETRDLIENARVKLHAKNADMIIANEVGPGKAFGTEGNEVYLVTEGECEHLPYMLKKDLADIILDKTVAFMR